MNKNRINAFFSFINSWIPYFCITVVYFADLIFLRILNRTHIDSDMSSMMVLASQLNKEGGILSKNWFYATELRVINTQLLFKIALRIFPDNWSVARLLVQAVMLAFYAVVLLLISKLLELGRTGVYMTAILLCPIGYWYLWYVIFANVYLTHILFCMISTVWSFLFIKSKSKRQSVCYLAFGIITAFMCSLNGIRYLMIYYVPFVVAAFAMMFLELRKYKNVKLVNLIRESFNKEVSTVKLSTYSILTMISAFGGYVFSVTVLSRKYPFQTMSKTVWSTFTIEKLLNTWSLFLGLFGYGVDSYIGNETLLFSLRGIASGLGLVLAGVIVFSVIRLLKRWHVLSFLNQLFIILCVSIFVVDSAIYAWTFSDAVIDNGSYWLHLFPYALILVAIELNTEDFSLSKGRELVLALMLIFILVISVGTVKWFYDEPLRENVHLTDVKNFLIETGCTEGYASFWYSNVLTELSDGKIEVWTTWDDVESLGIRPWGQVIEHAGTFPGADSFVLLGPDDITTDEIMDEKGCFSKVYADDFGYRVYVFK